MCERERERVTRHHTEILSTCQGLAVSDVMDCRKKYFTKTKKNLMARPPKNFRFFYTYSLFNHVTRCLQSLSLCYHMSIN